MHDVPGGRELLNVLVCGKGEPQLPKHLQPLDRDPTKTMRVCCCKDFCDNVFHQFSDLRLLSLTQINLTRFDLSFIANNPRLETLILDNNPIEELISDAQISLETLSLKNTMLKSIPNTTLHIMKHLKYLYIDDNSEDHIDPCEELKSLEAFNEKPCSQRQTVEIRNINEKLENNENTRLLPAIQGILLIVLILFL